MIREIFDFYRGEYIRQSVGHGGEELLGRKRFRNLQRIWIPIACRPVPVTDHDGHAACADRLAALGGRRGGRYLACAGPARQCPGECIDAPKSRDAHVGLRQYEPIEFPGIAVIIDHSGVSVVPPREARLHSIVD